MKLTAQALNDSFQAAATANRIELVVAESENSARAAAFELGQRLEQVVDFGAESAESFMDSLADDLVDAQDIKQEDALASVVKFMEGKLETATVATDAPAPGQRELAKDLV